MAASLSTSACSDIDVGAAPQLAKTGSRAATSLGDSVSATRDNLDSFIEGQYILAGLEPEKYTAPDAGLLGSISNIRNALTARAQLMSQLSEVYTSFGDLAGFDTGQFKTAVENLDHGINSYASAVGASAPKSPVAGAATGDVAGLLASEAQKQKLKSASENLRARLGPITRLMNDEASLVVGLQKVITQGTRDTAVAFFKHGFASPDPVLSSQIGSVGLEYVSGSYDRACSHLAAAKRPACKAKLQTAILQVVTQRSSRQADRQSKFYASSVEALKDLNNAHREFEHGAPLSLTSISSHIDEVQGIVDDLNAAEQKSAAKTSNK